MKTKRNNFSLHNNSIGYTKYSLVSNLFGYKSVGKEEKPKKPAKCFLDTHVFQSCPDNCKTNLIANPWLGKLASLCIAKEKMISFIDGENTFTVAITAFLQAQPSIVEEFANDSLANLDLVRYFFSICEPKDIKDTVENLSIEVLYKLLIIDYDNYLKIRDMLKSKKSPQANNYFALKSSKYWTVISEKKICEMISYLTKEKKEFTLASQFLLILSPDIISEFGKYVDLDEDQERELYRSLEDNIYTIPLISPKIYEHMTILFKDDMEIFFILQTMEELVKRRASVDEITNSFINYHNRTGQKLSIQWIYSELYGLEYELVVEVLNKLMEKDYLTISEKTTLQGLLKSGNLDFMKSVRQEILNA